MKSDEKSILIDALKIPDFGWQKSVDDARMKQWENRQEETCLSLHFFDKEPELTSGTLMNASDEARYDTDFPNHPLSRVRKVLQQVEAKLEFAPELQRLPKFYR